MGPIGHHLTGIAAGLLVAAATWPSLGPVSLVAVPFAFAGGTAPDWMELARAVYSPAQGRWIRQSVIPHRTITHWWPLWLALALLAWFWPFVIAPLRFLSFPPIPLNIAARMALAGFTAGGWMHLGMDIPNPTGIPLLTPFPQSRRSLHLWHSGNTLEPLAGLAMVGFAGLVLWLVAA